MRIAVEGCCHGELDRIYAALKRIERDQQITVDLLLVCGDFQSMRNVGDLQSLAAPDKYREMGTFHKYYSGEKKAPIPTIFIGGNHEASQYLWELFHGGWVAPNMYFLGFAGVINVGGLRIGGLSGIYKPYEYKKGYFEQFPLNQSDMRTLYHVRQYNTFRLGQIRQPLDIVLSHDWPRGIYFYGNTRRLIQNKPFLAGEINTNSLGSAAAEELLKILKPTMWFSAHLHVKFAAIYPHGAEHRAFVPDAATAATNPDEIDIDDDDMDDDQAEVASRVDTDAHSYAGEPAGSVMDEADDMMEDSRPQSVQGDDVGFVEDRQGDIAEDPSSTTGEIPATSELAPEEGSVHNTEAGAEVAATVDEMAQMTGVEGDQTQAEPQKEPQDNNEQPAPPPGSRLASIPIAKTHATHTKFLALDKCMPNKDFLQVIDIPDVDGPVEFFYDEEWLAIVRAAWPYFSTTEEQKKLPKSEEFRVMVETELAWLKENVSTTPDALRIPDNFVMTAEPHSWREYWIKADHANFPSYRNPQMEYLAKLLQVQNNINPNGAEPGDYSKRRSVDAGDRRRSFDVGVDRGSSDVGGSSNGKRPREEHEGEGAGDAPSGAAGEPNKRAMTLPPPVNGQGPSLLSGEDDPAIEGGETVIKTEQTGNEEGTEQGTSQGLKAPAVASGEAVAEVTSVEEAPTQGFHGEGVAAE
ncbi:lariat debranching enzyme [Rhizophlyctis rosea]|nr:lariat debranching enzyme [Rhizophlyctis rosea]